MIAVHPVYSGYYATKDGDVFNQKSARMVIGNKSLHRYYYLCLQTAGNQKSLLKHRFVYECFNGACEGFDIHHIDTDKSNNSLENLQKVTRQEHRHLTRKGTTRLLGSPAEACLITDGVWIVKHRFSTQADAGRWAGGKRVNISQAIRRKGCYKGFFWRRGVVADLLGEVWQACGDIKVSNMGRVESKLGLRSLGQDRGGYMFTSGVGVHRLVCQTFNGQPPQPHFTVDHINRDKSDNIAINLRWVDVVGQAQNNSRTRMVKSYDPETDVEISVHHSIRQAASETGVAHSSISDCCNKANSRLTAGGRVWRFCEPIKNEI